MLISTIGGDAEMLAVNVSYRTLLLKLDVFSKRHEVQMKYWDGFTYRFQSLGMEG